MALYKPKNLKPSISNGLVNINLEKENTFSFQLDGNEKIKSFSIYYEEPFENNKYKEVKPTEKKTCYPYYLDLERIDTYSYDRRYGKRTFVDKFREEYPVFDGNSNKNASISLKLPEGVESICLDSVYYQHEYRMFYETNNKGYESTRNVDMIFDERIPGANNFCFAAFAVDDWGDYFIERFPTVNNDYSKDLIKNKRYISTLKDHPLKFSTYDSDFYVSINGQQFYNYLQDPIAKSHFKEENPFSYTNYDSCFGVFNWIFLKFKYKLKDSDKDFYYIKGFIPELSTKLNIDKHYLRYFYSQSSPIYQYNGGYTNERRHWLKYSDYWSYDDEDAKALKKYGEEVYPGLSQDNILTFFGYDNETDTTNSIIYTASNWSLSNTISSEQKSLTIPTTEVIFIKSSVSDKVYDLENLISTTGELITYNNPLTELGYPIDSKGNNKTFNGNISIPIYSYNKLYAEKNGYLDWYVNVNGSKDSITSSKEKFLCCRDPIIDIVLGEEDEIKKLKNIPVSVKISYPVENNNTSNIFTSLFPEISFDDNAINKLGSLLKGGYSNYKTNFFRVFNKKGGLWTGQGEKYYKFKSPNNNDYVLILEEAFFDLLNIQEGLTDNDSDYIKKYQGKFRYCLKDKNLVFQLAFPHSFYKVEQLLSESENLYSDRDESLFKPSASLSSDYCFSFTDSNDNNKYYVWFTLDNIDIENADMSNLLPELKEITYYSYKIIDLENNHVVFQTDKIYTGDLDFTIDFLRPGKYLLELEIENSLGMKYSQTKYFNVEVENKNYIKNPNLILLKDSGVYVDWSNIPFLYASFSKGDFTDNDFYYNYPVAPPEDSITEYYKSLYIPKDETLTLNLLGQQCNYIAYCFQPVGQGFGYNEATGEDSTREVMIMQADKYWYHFSICMIDKEGNNGNYKYWLNIKAINQELEQTSATLGNGEENFIEFESSVNLITSEQLYFIMLFDKEYRKIYLKIYYNTNDSNILDESYVETISFDWNFIPIDSNIDGTANGNENEYCIQIENSEAWSRIFAPKYIQLLGNQVCSYIYGTSKETTIEDIDLNPLRTYDSENDKFFFNPNKTENYDIIAEDKTQEDILNTTVIRYDLANKTSKVVYQKDSYINNFIDYSAPSNIEYFYELYLGNNLDSPYITEVINTDDLGKWFLLVCDDVWDENGLNENKVTVADIFEFEANVTVGSMSNNTDFSISKNFTRYPKVQHSPSNYWSGTLGGLLGVISSGSRFTQTPEMLRRFKALTTDNRRKFLKDRDGNLWEISLSAANTIETNSKLDNQLKTASITWVEVADTANTMIYLDNYTDATWLQEENTLVSGPYNGRTQF